MNSFKSNVVIISHAHEILFSILHFTHACQTIHIKACSLRIQSAKAIRCRADECIRIVAALAIRCMKSSAVNQDPSERKSILTFHMR